MGRYISNANTNSYQDNELLLLKQGIAKNHKEFLTAGTNTWTIDHDVIARVRVWGGGGGGGGGYFRYTSSSLIQRIPGGGGGAGGAAEVILRLNAGTYNITVGDGGTAGQGSSGKESNTVPGTNGGNGGSSSFHTYITCSGGDGGFRGNYDSRSLGGNGGVASFNWSGFDGLLYVGGQFGGRGGSYKPGYYLPTDSNYGGSRQFSYGSEGGAGESGGPAGYALQHNLTTSMGLFMGGGGGGYNAPFIYGVNMSVQENSGCGVGTGGAGGEGNTGEGGVGAGYAGNSGAVVIEWN